MANFLKFLIVVMFVFCLLTFFKAKHLLPDSFITLSHISLAIPTFLIVIFIQAFVMFFLIGIHKLANNIFTILHTPAQLDELFENPPSDLQPYVEKMKKYVQQTNLIKRQVIPWTMLIIVLGMMGFLLGGAHDTGLVSKNIHVGLIYGFMSATIIGCCRQWIFLGKANTLLKEIKALFSIPTAQM